MSNEFKHIREMKQNHYHQLIVALLLGTSMAGLACGAELAPFGPPVDEPIVDAFIPPTRSDDPFVSSTTSVYAWNDEDNSWIAVYSPPWNKSRIEAVTGYAKSSEVIYVVHSDGIGRSGDKGASWIEASPPGFREISDGSNTQIVVDPAERKHAVVHRGGLLWETTDYGESYRKLYANTDLGVVLEMGFLPGSDEFPRLLVVYTGGVALYTGAPLKSSHQWTSGQRYRRACFLQNDPGVYLEAGDSSWQLLGFPVPELPGIKKIQLAADIDRAASISSINGCLLAADGNQLNLISLSDSASGPVQIATFNTSASQIIKHPRSDDSAYLVSARQLYLITGIFDEAGGDYMSTMALRGLDSIDWQATEDMDSHANTGFGESGKQPLDAAILLAQVLSGEPTYATTVQKALDHLQTKPGDFLDWQEKARKRHWLPSLRVEGGFREYGVDDNLLIVDIDQFGFERREDYRLPDRLENLGFMGIVLEWPLEQLVFDEELVDISRERRYYFNDRRELIKEIADLYYLRIDRIVEAKGFKGQLTQSRMLDTLLEISQLSEVLNGYCGESVFNPFPLD